MKAKILVLCTGNSCRSQMAESFIRTLDPEFEVFSAGTRPEKEVNKYAVAVMKEIGIDISSQYPKNAEKFTGEAFDYVITVCDNAREVCPVFTGDVKHRLHIGFDDPFGAKGSEEEILEVYRKVRDEIRRDFRKFYEEIRA
ncbi:MAG TPA: arsenate reductase ArsC [Ignavibacteria bacterium]|nr:arsenate reductase ArsC [Ignavibacteria bacterium]